MDPRLFEPLAKGEAVYRRVTEPPEGWPGRTPDGDVPISASCFRDPDSEPSVDRVAYLTDRGGPAYTAQGPENGVLIVSVGAIRAIKVKQPTGTKGKGPPEDLVVCAIPDPLPENDAHCLVKMTPPARNDTAFKKEREALALASSWAILPPPYR